MDLLFGLLDLESLTGLISQALQSQIVIWTFVFTVAGRAAWMKIRKDMKEDNDSRFSSVIAAIEKVATTVKEGFAQGEIRFTNIENRLTVNEKEIQKIKGDQ